MRCLACRWEAYAVQVGHSAAGLGTAFTARSPGWHRPPCLTRLPVHAVPVTLWRRVFATPRCVRVPMSVRLLAPWFLFALLPAQTWVARGAPELSRLQLGVAAATFDAVGGRLLLVDSQQHTWAGVVGPAGIDWTPQVGSLRALNPAATALAFDPIRGRTIATTFSPTGTMEWDGDGWVLVDSWLPPNRLAFDPVRGLLMGVIAPDLGSSTRTFERVGTAWVQRGSAQANLVPGPVAFDPVRGEVLMHGFDTAGVRRTHAWNGTTWQLVASNSGPDTTEVALATDHQRGRLVAHGGLRAGIAVADTWEWNGASWALLGVGMAPAARYRAFVEVPGRGLLALGGLQVDATGVGEGGAEGYLWDGVGWTSLPFAQPSWRTQHGLAYDAPRGEVVLFGGRDAQGSRGDTMVWNGLAWGKRTPATAPSPRYGAALAFDPVRSVVQLFGGTDGTVDFADLWQWDGATWSPGPAAAAPSPRSGAAVAFDTSRNRLLLFGGTSLAGPWANDTWQWDGVTWLQAAPARVPVALRQPRLAFDVQRGLAVLHGQNPNSLSVLGATYEWDGNDYTDFGGSHFRVGSQIWWDDAADLVRGHFTSAVTLAWVGGAWANSTLPAILYRQATGPSLAIVHDAARGGFGFDGLMTWQATAQRANAIDLGTGCGAVGRTPVLAAVGAPILGATTGVSVRLPAIVGGAVVVGLGFSSGSTSLGSGCTWYVSGSVASLLLSTDGYGRAELPLAVPPSPALRGLGVFGQALVLDAQAPLGFGLSQAIQLVLGD